MCIMTHSSSEDNLVQCICTKFLLVRLVSCHCILPQQLWHCFCSEFSNCGLFFLQPSWLCSWSRRNFTEVTWVIQGTYSYSDDWAVRGIEERNNHLEIHTHCCCSLLQIQVDDTYRKQLEYEFHSASYHTIMEMVTGLRIAVGHLIKEVCRKTECNMHQTHDRHTRYINSFFIRRDPEQAPY